jgi:hypothetical protein
MGRRATGPFEVKLNPQALYNTDETALLGRMSIDGKTGRWPLAGNKRI